MKGQSRYAASMSIVMHGYNSCYCLVTLMIGSMRIITKQYPQGGASSSIVMCLASIIQAPGCSATIWRIHDCERDSDKRDYLAFRLNTPAEFNSAKLDFRCDAFSVFHRNRRAGECTQQVRSQEVSWGSQETPFSKDVNPPF